MASMGISVSERYIRMHLTHQYLRNANIPSYIYDEDMKRILKNGLKYILVNKGGIHPLRFLT